MSAHTHIPYMCIHIEYHKNRIGFYFLKKDHVKFHEFPKCLLGTPPQKQGTLEDVSGPHYSIPLLTYTRLGRPCNAHASTLCSGVSNTITFSVWLKSSSSQTPLSLKLYYKTNATRYVLPREHRDISRVFHGESGALKLGSDSSTNIS